MENNKVICARCGRAFDVWTTIEKNIKCPFCSAEGKNPYYKKPEKIDPSKMFIKMK